MGLVVYNFAADLTPATQAGLTASSLTNVGFTSLAQSSTLNGSAVVNPPIATATSYATAISTGSYATVTITASSPQVLTHLWIEATKNTSANRGFGIRSSADSYAADLIDGTSSIPSTTPTTTVYAVTANVTFSTTLTLRIYGWTTGTTFFLDNLVIVTKPVVATLPLGEIFA